MFPYQERGWVGDILAEQTELILGALSMMDDLTLYCTVALRVASASDGWTRTRD